LLDREADIEVAGEAENGEQAVHAAERLRPDVILMDLEMPGAGGVDATRRITESRPDARIVVLTSHAAEEDVFPALKAGALGYLLKHSAPEEVLQAIRRGASRRDRLTSVDCPHGAAGVESAGAGEAAEDHRTALRARAGGAALTRAGHEQSGDRRHARGGGRDGAQPCQQHPEKAPARESDTGGAVRVARGSRFSGRIGSVSIKTDRAQQK